MSRVQTWVARLLCWLHLANKIDWSDNVGPKYHILFRNYCEIKYSPVWLENTYSCTPYFEILKASDSELRTSIQGRNQGSKVGDLGEVRRRRHRQRDGVKIGEGLSPFPAIKSKSSNILKTQCTLTEGALPRRSKSGNIFKAALRRRCMYSDGECATCDV